MVLTTREWALGIGLLALDQITKGLARATHPSNAFFDLTWNTGAGFGLLQGQNSMLLALSLIVLVVLAKPLWNAKGIEKILLIAFWIGVAGNAIDRVAFGAVTDFINILGYFNFPIFNVADALITVAAVYLGARFLRDTYHDWDFVKNRAQTTPIRKKK